MKMTLVLVSLFALMIGALAWFKLVHVVAQPGWITSDQRDSYFYGSVGADKATGLPYWIWLAMPRLFPEYMAGPGGYATLGMSWEEGKEMPIGFAKQRVGYIRVTGNCALCHVTSRPNGKDEVPTIIPFTKGKTTDIEPLLSFFKKCALDPRFNADEFLSEIDNDTRISLADRLLYRYILIPRIRKALIDDPAAVLLRPEILAHARNPRSEMPFSDPDMVAVEESIKQQRRLGIP
jgi:hypothetical protein